MDRAYSILSIKKIDDDERVIEGIASTPTPDRMGDIVDPMGAKFSVPMPLLWQHQHDKPVGHVEFAKPNKSGIPFRARLAKIDEPGTLRDRVEEAWQSLKAKLVSAVSIGFKSLEHSYMDNGGIKFKEWEWLELSLVTVPANAEATITTIKSIDRRQLAASGNEQSPRFPGGTGRTTTNPRGKAMKTIKELREERTEKAARMAELGGLFEEEAHDVTDAERAEFDVLASEIKSLDDDIRIAQAHQIKAGTAKPVVGSSPSAAARSRGNDVSMKSNLPKGTAFTRYVIAMANGRGSISDALEFAKRWKDSTPEVSDFIKAVPGTYQGGSGTWGSELVWPVMQEFLDLLMPETILGKISGFNTVPFNTRIVEHTAGALVDWVGEGSNKPVSDNAFEAFNLAIHKAAGIVVFSEELLRLSNPNAETKIRSDLVKQMSRFLDVQFIDPTVTATAGENPASVTQSVTPVPASGTDADAFRADTRALRAGMRAANIGLSGTYLVMNGGIADALADMVNNLGQPEFPTITSMGGTYRGANIVVSDSVPLTSSGSIVVLLKPSEILLADDSVTRVDASREATIDMGGDEVVNLWQQNLIAIRAERWITWLKAREAAVQYISGANYEQGTS
jgi:HK97 family phage major capsid protein/HK97 family phage prohead protease